MLVFCCWRSAMNAHLIFSCRAGKLWSTPRAQGKPRLHAIATNCSKSISGRRSEAQHIQLTEKRIRLPLLISEKSVFSWLFFPSFLVWVRPGKLNASNCQCSWIIFFSSLNQHPGLGCHLQCLPCRHRWHQWQHHWQHHWPHRQPHLQCQDQVRHPVFSEPCGLDEKKTEHRNSRFGSASSELYGELFPSVRVAMEIWYTQNTLMHWWTSEWAYFEISDFLNSLVSMNFLGWTLSLKGFSSGVAEQWCAGSSVGMRSAVLDEVTALQWRSRRLLQILRAWKDLWIWCGNGSKKAIKSPFIQPVCAFCSYRHFCRTPTIGGGKPTESFKT